MGRGKFGDIVPFWHKLVNCTATQRNHRYARIASVKSKFGILLLLLLLLGVPSSFNAQTSTRLSLRSLDTEQFPLLSGFVDARQAGGELIEGLQAEDRFVFEDGNAQPLENLRLVESDWRVAVAINPGEGFAIRDAEGFNRYDFVLNALSR